MASVEDFLREKINTIIYGKRQKSNIGLVIGTYSAIPYIHLGIANRNKYYPHIPILVVDDGSSAPLPELCRSLKVDFVRSPVRLERALGDVNVYLQGLLWAKENGFETLLKISRRFVPKYDWSPKLELLVKNSTNNTFSLPFRKSGIRTECMAMRCSEWCKDEVLDTLSWKIGEGDKTTFVEYFMCAVAGRVRGDKVFDLLELAARNGRIRQENVLWHMSHSIKEYWELSKEYGLPYTLEDFSQDFYS